jgi:hypothetical protein
VTINGTDHGNVRALVTAGLVCHRADASCELDTCQNARTLLVSYPLAATGALG